MRYVNYVGNVVRLAVELVNGDAVSEPEMFTQHHITSPHDVSALLELLRPAVAAVADGAPISAVNALLQRYPPVLRVSDHDDGGPHMHFAPDGEEPLPWIARTCGAALAHVISGDPEVSVGRCHADGCARFFIDRSRNRSRRFCSGTCASRTTVAAHRARSRPGL